MLVAIEVSGVEAAERTHQRFLLCVVLDINLHNVTIIVIVIVAIVMEIAILVLSTIVIASWLMTIATVGGRVSRTFSVMVLSTAGMTSMCDM